MSLLSNSTTPRNSVQLDLFPSSTPTIIGTVIPAECPCKHCGSITVTVGSSRGPHYGSLRCDGRGRHSGWLPAWRWRALVGEPIVDAAALASSFAFATGLSSEVPW